MDKTQLRNYYENYLDLFVHPGWSQLMDQLDEELQAHQQTVFDRSKEEFDLIKGQVSVLRRLRGFPLLVEQSLEALEEEWDETI